MRLCPFCNRCTINVFHDDDDDDLTRTQSNIHIHRADTTFGQRSIRYKGGTLWNSLSHDLKTTSSTNQFKIKLKHLFLIDNQ